MRAFITGGAGFIGSHLAELSLNQGYNVIVLDNLRTGALRNIAHLAHGPNFKFHEGDVMDYATVSMLMKDADIVYHLAAAVGVKQIMENALESLRVNTKGTENILEIASEQGMKVIIVSTSEIYGKNLRVPYAEDGDRVLGSTTVTRWGYSCSKAFDEFLALAYYREKRLPVTILRLFNTVGPRQTGRYGMVIPRFVEQALQEEPITVYGDGEQRRSFTYVKDVVKAMADISLVKEAEGEVFNIGSDTEITINDLAKLVQRTLKSSSEIIHIPYEEVYGKDFEDMRRRLPNISKIKSYIDYRPTTNLTRIIEEVAEEVRNAVEREV